MYTVRFRNYDASIGRWLERDPAGYVDGMSYYEYVRSNPINGVDPNGLNTFTDGARELWGMITGGSSDSDKEWEAKMQANADLMKKKVDESQNMTAEEKKQMKWSIANEIDTTMQELEWIRQEEAVEILETSVAIVETVGGVFMGGAGFYLIGFAEAGYYAANGQYG